MFQLNELLKRLIKSDSSYLSCFESTGCCLHSKIAILHSVIVHRNCFGHVVIFCEE